MKKELLQTIICPLCKIPFSLRVFEGEGERVKQGLLKCQQGHFFPIINSIPRILTGNLRELICAQFPGFFAKYKEFLPVKGCPWRGSQRAALDSSLQKKKTAQSFGYEWTKFSEMLPDWEKNFKWYFEPLPFLGWLKGKIALELGCGKGRHIFYAAKYAKEIIAVDLSSAIDSAFYNNRGKDNVHFIQADVFNLPFRNSCFDFVYSIGVLHHLPDPEAGFKALLKLLKIEGGILIYIYHSFSKRSFHYYGVKLLNRARLLTTKMSHKLLDFLCYPMAALSYLIFVLPCKIFIKKETRFSWPLKFYVDYPFRVLLNDTFDRFATPIENRYSREEALGWFQRAGLKNINILPGWRLFGEKTEKIV